jgi:hypothetical protein
MSSPNSWPLPNTHLLLGLSTDPGLARVRSEVEAGPPRMRRRFTAAVRHLSGRVVLSGPDLVTFRDWGKLTLKDWSLSFSWTEPEQDFAADYRFVQPPTWGLLVPGLPQNRIWTVEMRLEVLP